MKYNEIFRLKQMLDKEKIPYEFFNRGIAVEGICEQGYQICYPCSFQSENGQCICSVIEHFGSYGNEKDLLEIMGLLTPEEYECDSVKGWLTAENVFERIKKHYEEVKQ